MKRKDIRGRFYKIVITSIAFILFIINITFMYFTVINNNIIFNSYEEYLNKSTELKLNYYINMASSEISGSKQNIKDMYINKSILTIDLIINELSHNKNTIDNLLTKISEYSLQQYIFVYYPKDFTLKIFANGEVEEAFNINYREMNLILKKHSIYQMKYLKDYDIIIGTYFNNNYIEDTIKAVNIQFLENLSLENEHYIWIDYSDNATYNWRIGAEVNMEALKNALHTNRDIVNAEIRKQNIVSTILICIVMLVLLGIIFILEKYYFSKNLKYREELEHKSTYYIEKVFDLKHYHDIDAVTEIYNRRYMIATLTKLFKQSHKTGEIYSIILSDIDFFKNVNDTYGHDAGDYILHEVSKLMGENISNADMLARYGGEEFIIIINFQESKNAYEIAERLRKLIETEVFNYCSVSVENAVSIKITMSFGIAYFNITDKNYMDAVNRADKALYLSKNEGRNRVNEY